MPTIKPKKISKNVYEIPKSGKMKVPVKIYASEKLLNSMKKDNTLEQAQNMAMLPGIVKQAILCPDGHNGYGFPIGGVAAFDMEKGIISPGGVGYDINCGVRLLATNLMKRDIQRKIRKIVEEIFAQVPSGVGRGGKMKLSKQEIKQVLETGANWAVKKGYGEKEDLERTEDNGCIKRAKASAVSERALARGLSQLGSLGAGNHFLEVGCVDEIYDKETAKVFGITEKNQITIMIHCGSRGLGHQVASDYIKSMEEKYGFEKLPDRELINAPIRSELGQKYFSAMTAAANFGFCNRQLIMHWVRQAFNKVFGKKIQLNMVYDVAHNMAKFEEHIVDGKNVKLCIHRKGATRSFGPGRKELPKVYQKTGQPVIIPGSMGTASYILVGTKKAEEVSFASTAHGAGRVMSRHSALKKFRGEKVKNELAEKKGIEVKSGSWKSLAEEAPEVYKDIDEVVRVSHDVGIGNLVARLKPLGVMKG